MSPGTTAGLASNSPQFGSAAAAAADGQAANEGPGKDAGVAARGRYGSCMGSSAALIAPCCSGLSCFHTWLTQATARLASMSPGGPTGVVTPGKGATASAKAWSAIAGLTSPFGPSIAITESNAVPAGFGDVGCGAGE